MLARCVSVLIKLTNHRVCCRIPEWTAHVGRPWDTYDVQPRNLYNVWWRFGQSGLPQFVGTFRGC